MSEPITEHDLETRRAIEAVVLAATEPVPPQVLAQLLEVPTARVEELCTELADEYARERRGFVLARVAGGYRFQTHPEAAPYVERFVLDGQHVRLSGPALETLAIIAYKQPISRAQLSAIRGVNVDATLRTLLARGYVEETGHEHTPGNPALFGTTTLFLDKIGVDSLADLPSLGGFVPEAHVVEALERGLCLPGEESDGALQHDAASGGSEVLDLYDHHAVGVAGDATVDLPGDLVGDVAVHGGETAPADGAPVVEKASVDLVAELLEGIDPGDADPPSRRP